MSVSTNFSDRLYDPNLQRWFVALIDTLILVSDHLMNWSLMVDGDKGQLVAGCSLHE
jgi:hypothetical protein